MWLSRKPEENFHLLLLCLDNFLHCRYKIKTFTLFCLIHIRNALVDSFEIVTNLQQI